MRIWVTAVLLLCCLSSAAWTQEEECIQTAKEFVHYFEGKNFRGCTYYIDSSVRSVLSEGNLQQAFDKIHETTGRFKSQLDASFENSVVYYTVLLGCSFENMEADYKCVFSPKTKKLIGFFLTQPTIKHKYKIPSYASESQVIERPITIITDTFKLPGILTLPKNVSKPPVVVFVHGSGPTDKDETIKANKPFKDLALGLASMGIASIRYDKRTFVYGVSLPDLGHMTPKEEVTDDALSAIRLARSLHEVDTSKVFLLGHSLGAFLAPRLATLDGHLKGIILMAAPARHFEDVTLDQQEFLLPQQTTKHDADSIIETIRKDVATIKAKSYTDDTPPSRLLGVPASYWNYLNNYDQIATAKKLTLPMLFLQGDRDYQVGPKDFRTWKEALLDNNNATFQLYEGLYHLFMPGHGTFTDYNEAGNVSEEVVATIAGWVKSK